MLPLSLLRAATGSSMLVELKSGETYNGVLASCDAYMNLSLTQVICTASTGDRFTKLVTANIRGSAIKYLRLPDECLGTAQLEDETQERDHASGGGRGRGGSGGRGRGRGRFGDRGGRGRGRGGGRNNDGQRGRGGGRGRNTSSSGGGASRGSQGRSSGRSK